MNLRDAKEQIDREHPEMSANQRIAAIKALRASDRAAGDSARATEVRAPSKPSAWPLWAVQLLWIAIIQLTLNHWHGHQVLIVVGWAVTLVVVVATGGWHRRAKERWEAAQRPV